MHMNKHIARRWNYIIFRSTDGCWQYDGLKFKKKTGRWWKNLITSCVIFDCCSMTQNKGYCTWGMKYYSICIVIQMFNVLFLNGNDKYPCTCHSSINSKSVRFIHFKWITSKKFLFLYLLLRRCIEYPGFVSDLRKVGGFLRVLRFPPPIKLTATI
jgi:hypothetical protein